MANGKSAFLDTSKFIESIKSGFSSIFDVMFLSLFSSLNREAEVVFDRLEARTINLQARLLRNLAASAIIAVSMIFIISAGYFYLVEMQGLSRASSFLALGVVLFLIGLFAKRREWRYEHGSEKAR